jgi:hypothetical protein
MGIADRRGRTSRLKRFLSMPKYEGASRSLMNRGKNGDDLARRLVRSGSGTAEETCASIYDLIERVVPVVQGRIVTDGNCAFFTPWLGSSLEAWRWWVC